MRATSARWVICALALSICVPAALAKGAKKSLADCTSFKQTEKGDDAFELTVHNSCKAQIACSMSWKVTCNPDSPKRRTVHEKSSKFTLSEGTGQTVEASAAICGDEPFTISSVQWGCEPSKQ